ncbi:MAG: ubiquinol-cytochrome c reductase iron-sulfur subunit [Alphaproteobacteria bacterium]|jgi:ubiquinol-cytochrome c reductase iron-sulfur subunit|nr:ubiquinol-cytochrome c reductase iron-sulfur subunit [Alphaproteobacteria bacterium]
MADITQSGNQEHGEESSRRDFLYLAVGAMAAVGAGAAIWPFVDSMNPAADVRALASIEVNLSAVDVGQAITVTWRGKPVFIRHRTEEEIAQARSVDLSVLPDPQTDEERVVEAPWLVMIGICTHLGCVPLGQKPSDQKGDYGGWFCPCHGSHYDEAGRIRRGPAPRNLDVPPYDFTGESTIQIG